MGADGVRRDNVVQDANGQRREDAAPAAGVAGRAESDLKIGQGGDGGNGRGELEPSVARAFRGGIGIEIGIGHKGVGQALGDEDVAHGPGGGEGGATAKDDGVGGAPGGMAGREGLCEGIEGADLLLVEGALTSCTSGRESRSGALSAALERRQEGGHGGGEASGEEQEGQDARIWSGGGVVAQTAAEGVGDGLRALPQRADCLGILRQRTEGEGIGGAQEQVAGGGRIGMQAAGQIHQRSKVVPRRGRASRGVRGRGVTEKP